MSNSEKVLNDFRNFYTVETIPMDIINQKVPQSVSTAVQPNTVSGAVTGTPEAWLVRGISYMEDGQYAEAEECFRRTLALAPDSPETVLHLGYALNMQGRSADAEAAYRQAIALKPDYVEAHINLGNLLYGLGRFGEAETAYRQVTIMDAGNAKAYYNLANLLYGLGRVDEAEVTYCQAIALRSDYAEAHSNRGSALYDLDRLDEAEMAYRLAITIKADYAEAYYNLGNTLYDLGRLDEAEAAHRQAINIKPEFVEAHNNLGNALRELCRLDEAEAAYRHAISLNPYFALAYSNLLMTLQCICSRNIEDTFAEALNFGRHFEASLIDKWGGYDNSREPDKQLKIGVVSGDLCNHPVGYFLEAVLRHLDQKSIALYAYANRVKKDELSERIRPFFEEWLVVKGMSDESLASQIRTDGIDILIDLAGHTAENRLLTFAHKPAPLQVTWLGYPNTTGMRAVDYILADPVTIPSKEEKFYTERIWRLPDTSICFTPPDSNLEINSLPGLGNGYISFGCFNNPAKLNESVIASWAEILRAVPDSTLLFKNKQRFNCAALRDSFRQRFMNLGVDPARLYFEGASSRFDLIASYQRIDIALDPFPYTGTTTTCEAAWMGVPTLTLKMERGLYSRYGELIMKSVGLADWVAESVDEYIGKALAFSRDMARLAQIRSGLRDQLLNSPLCNAPRFANNLELALRGMWQQWCSQNHMDDTPSARHIDTPRKLHIGGTVRAEGWEVFSINEDAYVDHSGNAKDLSRFSDNTFSEIYASHVLEHFDYIGELLETLKEWNRVLKPGGILYVSVPDLDVLTRLYLDKDRQDIEDRFLLMAMMFGGHSDKHDFHLVGFNEELLSYYLGKADFINHNKVAEFEIFHDTSSLRFKGELISLNTVAYKKANG